MMLALAEVDRIRQHPGKEKASVLMGCHCGDRPTKTTIAVEDNAGSFQHLDTQDILDHYERTPYDVTRGGDFSLLWVLWAGPFGIFPIWQSSVHIPVLGDPHTDQVDCRGLRFRDTNMGV